MLVRILVGLIAVLLAAPVQAVGFRTPTLVGFSSASGPPMAGDIDGDGFDDAAAGVPGENGVAVLWNDGTGRLGPASQLVSFGFPVTRVLLADLNKDGRADVIVTGAESMPLRVRLATPGRGFAPAVSYPLTVGPDPHRAMLAADVDGDTNLDVVVGSSNSLAILSGDGSGVLTLPAGFGVPGVEVLGLAVGELDRLPGLDLLMWTPSQVRAWHLSAGRFEFWAGYLSGLTETDVVFTDVEADGFLDAVSLRDGVIHMYRFNSSGSVDSLVIGATTLTNTRTVATELNGDGHVDLMASSPSGEMAVYYGDGAGFVGEVRRPLSPQLAEAPALGDFDGDGDGADYLIQSLATTGVSGASSGYPTFDGPWAWPVGAGPVDVALGDVDADLDMDVVIANRDDRSLSLRDGAGAALGSLATSGRPAAVEILDVDGDGRQDIVALTETDALRTTASGGLLELFRGIAGGFELPQELITGQGPTSFSGGDLDGDGRGDLAVALGAARSLELYHWQGAALGPAVSLALPFVPTAVATGDFDGDGALDLAAVGPADGVGLPSLAVFRNTQAGPGRFVFEPPVVASLVTGLGPTSLVAVDLEADGRDELGIAASGPLPLLLLVVDAAGDPAVVQTHDLPRAPVDIAAGHLNCDAGEDLLVALVGDGALLFLSEADRPATAPAQSLVTGMGPSAIISGPLDGEGSDDVIVVHGPDQLQVWWNLRCALEDPCDDPQTTFHSGCVGQPVTLEGPTGYARYRWQNGASAPAITVQVPGTEAPWSVAGAAQAGGGCWLPFVHTVNVAAPPQVILEAASTIGCSVANTSQRFPIHAAIVGDPMGVVALDWSIEPPAVLQTNGPQDATAVVPPGAEGEFLVEAHPRTTSCAGIGGSILLRLVDDRPAAATARLTVTGGSAGVNLAWSAPGGYRFDVHRAGSAELQSSPESLLHSGVEQSSWVDQPPPAPVWYYSVQTVPVCGPTVPLAEP